MPKYGLLATLALTLAAASVPVLAQSSSQSLEGMWSDPPTTPEDMMCFFWCTDMALDHLEALLDDPENDDRPYMDLRNETIGYQVMEYVRPRLTAAALETFPLDELKDDAGYLYCEPWGLAEQMFAPHQLELHRVGDRLEMHYGEWDAHRTVHMDGRPAPARTENTRFGYSVGHYEGDTLVIETSHVSANVTSWRAKHSDQLRTTERFTRDGDRLLLTATIEDPWGLREPLQVKKIWSWAPDQQIFPYDQCKPAAGSAEAGRQ